MIEIWEQYPECIGLFTLILWLVSDNIINLKIYDQILHEKTIALTFFV